MSSAPGVSLEELRRESDALRASRARLLAAADAERRAIERELHDGALQDLVALAVNLQYVELLLETDPGAARGVLQELSRDLHDALANVRGLAHRVYPALLADHGLPDALRSAATELRVRARIEADGLARSTPDLETTAYFACLAALRSFGSPGTDGEPVTIRLRRDTAGLDFEVAADDHGHRVEDVDAALADARDRVEALGGRLAVRADAASVRVTASIPDLDGPLSPYMPSER
jgi:signal transduction histidine kinase